MKNQYYSETPFVIAEVGSNWGDFTDAKDSVTKAAMAGANAVKFQIFDWSSLYGTMALQKTDALSNQDLILKKQAIDKNSLPKLWVPKLKEKADACNIEFMCSAFSPELYEFIDPFVSTHKIASSEITSPPILAKVKSLGKPILLSVGASSIGDIKLALNILKDGPKVTLMFCVSAYPSHLYNLFAINDLKALGCDVGFSDHSLDIYPVLSAYKHFGCKYIEKHVNFSPVDDQLKTKSADINHSLTHEDFVYMMQFLRGTRNIGTFNPTPEEKEMFLRHNRRIVATKDIKAGDRFTYPGNFGFYRMLEDDADGIHSFAWEDLIKCSGAKRDIKMGTPISPQDVLWG